MNYKNVVDTIKKSIEDHLMISDYGYGDPSDIKVRSESGGSTNADYPYMFINPGVHNRSGNTMIYRFNLITMDLVKDDDYLKVQSECQEYIDDIIVRLRNYNRLEVLTSTINYVTFKERFMDTVAGMTAEISIQVKDMLDSCTYPYEIEN